MKSPILVLFLLGAAAFAVDRPKGFLGIAWGASPEEAKRVLQGRSGVKFPEESDDYHVELTGGTFAGQTVTKWVLEFPDRKFASAAVTLKTDGNASAVYKEFRTQLVAKYGSVTSDKKPSAGGAQARKTYNGERQPALGNVATWKFLPTMKDKTSIVISAELAGPGGKPANDESQLAVTVRYVNESLTGTPAAGTASAKTAHAPVKKDDL
jgi:hypothetical protein